MAAITEVPGLESYPSPVDLPEGKFGRVILKHKYIRHAVIAPMREVMLTGSAYGDLDFDPPRRVHVLQEGGQTWIQDIPAEIRQHQQALNRWHPWGSVLVGGLGLGIMAHLLARLPGVARVTVVEKSLGVIKLCDPKLEKVTVVHADLYEYLRKMKPRDIWQFTGGFFDLWRATSEGTWWEEVLPLRRLLGQRFGAVWPSATQYWAEDQMLAQVAPKLMTDPSDHPDHWYYRPGLGRPMTEVQVRNFIWTAGTPKWERRYGSIYPERR